MALHGPGEALDQIGKGTVPSHVQPPRAARQVVSSKSRFDPDMAEKRRTGRLVGPGHPVDPGVETFIGKRSHPERQRLRLEPERDHRAG